jgi:hypothetical protein
VDAVAGEGQGSKEGLPWGRREPDVERVGWGLRTIVRR